MKTKLNTLIWVVGVLFTLNSCKEDEGNTFEDFVLESEAVVEGELLEAYKCEEVVDGAQASIPLAWSGVPSGTASLAVTMKHYPDATPNEPNSYLLLWNIDADVTEIPHGAGNSGPWFIGANKDGQGPSYSSPCSPSAGVHEYTITLYALSELPTTLPAESTTDVTLEVLETAISTVTTIGTATLTFNDVNN